MTLRRTALALTATAALWAAGCSGSQPSAEENLAQQQQTMTEAMNRLAGAIEKKDQTAIAVSVEELTSSNMDAKANPAAAREMVDVYNKRVKGKLRGDQASQVKLAVDQVEQQLK